MNIFCFKGLSSLSEILRWDFDSIEVLAYEHGREEGERSFYIERKDLLPDIDTLKYFYAKYSEKIYPFWDNAYDRDRAEKNAEELFTHLMKEKLYYKFLCNCLFDISNSMEINTILKIYDYNNKIYINTIPNLMKELEKHNGCDYGQGEQSADDIFCGFLHLTAVAVTNLQCVEH